MIIPFNINITFPFLKFTTLGAINVKVNINSRQITKATERRIDQLDGQIEENRNSKPAYFQV